MKALNPREKVHKTSATLTGVFFIIAAVASIIGLKLYDPVLTSEDYLIMGAQETNKIISGAIFELILACSAVGTGIMLYPYLKKHNESLGLGYVCFRLLEVVFILIGTVSVLALLTLSNLYTKTSSPSVEYFKVTGTILKGIHDWAFMLGPNFMLGVNTFIYSYIFYHSNLVPKKLSILGILGAILIFFAAILEMFGVFPQISTAGVLIALPIFAYEMTLAIWLIIKGFNHNTLINTATSNY